MQKKSFLLFQSWKSDAESSSATFRTLLLMVSCLNFRKSDSAYRHLIAADSLIGRAFSVVCTLSGYAVELHYFLGNPAAAYWYSLVGPTDMALYFYPTYTLVRKTIKVSEEPLWKIELLTSWQKDGIFCTGRKKQKTSAQRAARFSEPLSDKQVRVHIFSQWYLRPTNEQKIHQSVTVYRHDRRFYHRTYPTNHVGML